MEMNKRFVIQNTAVTTRTNLPIRRFEVWIGDNGNCASQPFWVFGSGVGLPNNLIRTTGTGAFLYLTQGHMTCQQLLALWHFGR
jgi:hypothetical protein